MDRDNGQSNYNEKRNHPRINSSHFIEYILFDEKPEELDRGEGRTLDLSRGGILLETQRPLCGVSVTLTILDSTREKIEIEGRVANTRKDNNSGFYLTGVEFTCSENEQINAIIAFLKTYNRDLKVIIIDDDSVTLSFLDRILQKRGFHTWQAQNGKAALDKIRSIQPDLIISDIIMPVLDGFELFTALRESPATANIPFIFLSVKADPLDQLKGLRLGADEYLVKPCKSVDILEAVDRILEKSARNKGGKNNGDIQGNLAQIGLIEVIQMIEFNEKTGELFLLSPSHNVTGAVYIKEGEVVNAVSGNLEGEEAFYELASQTDGFFKFYIHNTIAGSKIQLGNMALLMEASRLVDEAVAFQSMISAMDVRLALATPELPVHVRDRIPDDVLTRIMALIRDDKTVYEIASGTGMSWPKTASVLMDLINCSVVVEQKAGQVVE